MSDRLRAAVLAVAMAALVAVGAFTAALAPSENASAASARAATTPTAAPPSLSGRDLTLAREAVGPAWSWTSTQVETFLGLAAATGAVCAVVGAGVLAAGAGLLATGACITLAVATYAYWEAEFGKTGYTNFGSGSSEANVQALAELMLNWWDTAYQGATQDAALSLALYNTSTPYFAEQADAAALSQLGNSTFNPALDLVQAGVANEIGSLDVAFPQTLMSLQALLEENFTQQMDLENPSAYACGVGIDDLGGSVFAFPSGTGTNGACGSNGGLTTWSGVEYSAEGLYLPECSDVSGLEDEPAAYINGSWPLLVNHGTNAPYAITASPVNGGTPVTVTLTYVDGSGDSHSGELAPSAWTAAAGAYYLCASDYPLVLFPTGGYPIGNYSNGLLDASPSGDLPTPSAQIATVGRATEGDFGYDSDLGMFLIGNDSSENFAGQVQSIRDDADTGDAPSFSYTSFSDETFTSPLLNAATVNLPYYLANIETAATTEGQAYWSFLRDAGYTSASSVPSTCAIPPPAQVLPPTLTPAVLATLNYTQVKLMYESILQGIAYAYGGTTLNWENCVSGGVNGYPKPPTAYGGNGPCPSANFTDTHGGCAGGIGGTAIDPMGSYAFGYLTRGCSGSDCSTDGYTFNKPKTWDDSGNLGFWEGVLYFAPTLYNYALPTDEPLLLNSHDPTNIWVQPFEGSFDSAVYQNTTAPSYCVNLTLPAEGCNVTTMDYLWPVLGNYTAEPTTTTAPICVWAAANSCSPDVTGSGYTVWLTGCAVPSGTSSDGPNNTTTPKWTILTGNDVTCDFDIGSVYAHPWNTTCGGTISQACGGGGGGVLTGKGSCPIFGFVASALANALGGIPYVGPTLAALSCVFVYAIVAAIVLVLILAVWRS